MTNSEADSRLIAPSPRLLTREEFQGLSEVPPELEWFANLDNPHTKRAYMRDVREFMAFTGIVEPREFRDVGRPHVIAWRKQLEARKLSASTIRRKLSALGSLYDFLCERNAIEINPTHGVKRPSESASEGKTPTLGDADVKKLLDAPPLDTLKGLRDRAILATYLFHGIRCAELSSLTPSAIENRGGFTQLRIHGKRSKIRYVPLHPLAQKLITDYLDRAGHGDEKNEPLFRSVSNRDQRKSPAPLSQAGLYTNVIKKWALKAGIDPANASNHAMRATAATNVLSNGSDMGKVQKWLGHANISTTRIYDRRDDKPEDSPTYNVKYS